MNTATTAADNQFSNRVDGLHTFACDGAWRPVSATPKQGDRTAEYSWAWRNIQVVHNADGIAFHGDWTTHSEARRFAASLPHGGVVREGEPYRYAPAFGKF